MEDWQRCAHEKGMLKNAGSGNCPAGVFLFSSVLRLIQCRLDLIGNAAGRGLWVIRIPDGAADDQIV